MKNKKIEFWNDLSKAEKKEIKKGIEDLDNGRKISYPDLQKTIS